LNDKKLENIVLDTTYRRWCAFFSEFIKEKHDWEKLF
jgi:hypothetical protein